MEIRKVDAGQPGRGFASDGVERLRVATTCGSPLVVLISGRLPAQVVGKVVRVAGAFRGGAYVVVKINPHVFAVDAAAEYSVTNAIAVFVADPADADLGAVRRECADGSDAAPRPSHRSAASAEARGTTMPAKDPAAGVTGLIPAPARHSL